AQAGNRERADALRSVIPAERLQAREPGPMYPSLAFILTLGYVGPGSARLRFAPLAVRDDDRVKGLPYPASFFRGSIASLAAVVSALASYFTSSGYCRAPNRKVAGSAPNSLKLTQKLVEVVRQTISLITAMAKKNRHQRSVSLRQPSSVRLNTESNTISRSGLRVIRPNASVAPNSV